ncbi:MAG: hypothetical protein M3O71_32215 [Bacteroidota bacterium]|nr:hypothetical protein [Bacteroidota bacterium]
MYFDSFKDFPDARINPSLLWEYDISRIDYEGMRDIIVQRVVERGWPDDWYAMLNLYGVAGVKSAIKNIPYLNKKDMNFVSHQFKIPLSAMKCYKNKQSAQAHWNS